MTLPSIKMVYQKEKKEILEKLSYFGITKLPFLLTESGKEKIRGYSGMLSAEKILELDKKVGIELIGLYLFHNYPDNIRMSFDAISALKSQITKNILEITDEQAQEFLKGHDIALSKQEHESRKQQGEKAGFKIIKNQDDLLGTGKLTEEGRIVNYMPKERRIR